MSEIYFLSQIRGYVQISRLNQRLFIIFVEKNKTHEFKSFAQ